MQKSVASAQALAEPLGPFQRLGTKPLIAFLLLFCTLVASAISLVYTKHLSRILYAKLENLQIKKDDYHIEWSQLLLERGTIASDARVEALAHHKLGMSYPTKQDKFHFSP
ncbi:MAG: cell division protein FtsL [Gammaproteobacteria bacterium]